MQDPGTMASRIPSGIVIGIVTNPASNKSILIEIILQQESVLPSYMALGQSSPVRRIPSGERAISNSMSKNITNLTA